MTRYLSVDDVMAIARIAVRREPTVRDLDSLRFRLSPAG